MLPKTAPTSGACQVNQIQTPFEKIDFAHDRVGELFNRIESTVDALVGQSKDGADKDEALAPSPTGKLLKLERTADSINAVVAAAHRELDRLTLLIGIAAT